MNFPHLMAGAVLLFALSSCGGGSGDKPTSIPVPPAPDTTNTSLKNLRFSQSFTNDATSLSGAWDTVTGTAVKGDAEADKVSVSYNADTKTYTVGAGTSSTFGEQDIVEQDDLDTRYDRKTEGGSEQFTLLGPTDVQTVDPQYVAIAFLQRNAVIDKMQNVEFSTFTYGLPAAAAMVPRSGEAAFDTDVFGLVTKPGEEPATFRGLGAFSVDFAEGVFTTTTPITQFGLVTGREVSGGGIELVASGRLTSGTNGFSGPASLGSPYGLASGTIAGRFYGPSAQELGASFQANGPDGMAAVGSLVGVKDSRLTAENQTLTNLKREQLFYLRGGGSVGSINVLNSQTFVFSAPSSDMLSGRFSVNDKIASKDANFTTYAKTGDAGYGVQDVVLELYRPGAANNEVALTYASFGHWSGKSETENKDYYFVYGFQTANNLLTARTGRAQYSGVAYGTGVNADASRRYAMEGTSSFNIDFSRQNFGGQLALKGTEHATGSSTDFGRYDIDGALYSTASFLSGDISNGANPLGTFEGYFFGSDAQELAGTFYFVAPAGTAEALDVGISGATVAKRN
ncbi:transferrin-binding protein-like solute binding protein [Croceicoccus sp. F390]|uniref:Transferrin-binding protein-like solute binding protein n=1 Tax=Croceicoccus esteveae TaxID=3075597 RepID=A0ABU2ZH78_9SPHN|nr:transferrin-binding protein-like solute binding protein [Croceicoccus sp. F390]MDT0575953.1 transferrin-binding protein-like solute binding protein [Croceicoccus sp. F390]